ncbi:hypothetical protein PK35_13880 [Tamlana nanhaiensis]|uniref:DUF1569 domain-containing protein n=1 Tax=Neotamlana nanhaiensis TaxID=1382798 RepID=A0A0D7VXC8_9FLAO|nr:DUF1569 domain-containing protein [Tamlana nanhaiensis]KJD31501.1 hypothetical protein PK35_13880 [Tamlana nanhaiensis]
MKSIFEDEAKTEIISRLDKLTENSQANWGKMNVNQMIIHCTKPIEVSLGEKPLEKPNLVMRLLFKMVSSSLYNDKPWKQGLPTAKEYITTNINSDTFVSNKALLKTKIEQMSQSKSYFEPKRKHPYFGTFTADQWGQSNYKHLDHHLRQFGA